MSSENTPDSTGQNHTQHSSNITEINNAQRGNISTEENNVQRGSANTEERHPERGSTSMEVNHASHGSARPIENSAERGRINVEEYHARQDNYNTEENPPRPLTVLERHGYHLGRVIGTGTFSTIQRAYSDSHQRNVAIKIINKSDIPRRYLETFVMREVDVAMRVNHPNIIRFYEAIETTRRVYIIMEEAQNGTLLDLIRNQNYLSEDRARRIFTQILDVMEYCYSLGIVHRDIKCENLLLDQGFNIKLTDFGFARGGMFPEDGRPRMSESFCGSYAYAAPEVLTGQRHDPYLSDVWSAGVVLYAMVFGRMPFNDSDRIALLRVCVCVSEVTRRGHTSGFASTD
ncbi:testis-specific serine/threonine-protein kinase 3-like isoform X2 [Bacillus rossius redtenbacheri]|uniref:testis-specific serine/threonine-protein kinase 3-like isoform X2 n=1 Tax=Bacillus rossius redtenbacheri TaxID=93214 RepID=UPI002FDC92A6